jgi:hypothetical protein
MDEVTRLRVLTWHVHGTYLYYLTQSPHTFVLPVRAGRPHPYGGRTRSFPWGDNVVEVPADRLRDERFDVILFQSPEAYERDQYKYLSPAQWRLPRLYLEHDPPRGHPTDTRHVVDDPDVAVVHVTHFNQLMWDCGRSPTLVIPHGVLVPPHVAYTGTLERGIVVVNNLRTRGRRLGADVFERARSAGVPLDLVGMDARSMGGLGEVPPADIAEFIAPYRFLFNPIRYTSLGLSVCEAMALGMPAVGLATTEMATTVEDGVSGYVSNDVDTLVGRMRALLADPGLAARLGEGARAYARRAFSMERFIGDWDAALQNAVARARRTPGDRDQAGPDAHAADAQGMAGRAEQASPPREWRGEAA